MKPIEPTDIEHSTVRTVTIDLQEGTLTVDAYVHLNKAEGTTGDVTHSFDLTMRAGADNKHVTATTHDYVKHLVQLIKDGPESIPCETCSASCCHNWAIEVTDEDVQRIVMETGFSEEKFLTRWTQPAASGHVGALKMRKAPAAARDELAKQCTFLHKTKLYCTIYPSRPQVCRDYSHTTCDVFIEDEQKVAKKNKVSLPLWPG